MYLLTTPFIEVPDRGVGIFRRTTFRQGVSLLKEAGFYRQVDGPTDEEIAAADIAYLGGHRYLVSDAEAGLLTVAGYGANVELIDAYGWDDYGEGLYGVDDYGS